MLFPKATWVGIADGSITRAYRWWAIPRVVTGRPYRTPAGRIEVEAVTTRDPGTLTRDDAKRAGYPTVDALLAAIARDGDRHLYEVLFRFLDEPDPRSELAATASLSPEDVAAIDARLARYDRDDPWTAATLDIIRRRPGVRAGDLAVELGRELQPFKLDVRKLKALGLTESLRVGYRLSPRGSAYLSAAD